MGPADDRERELQQKRDAERARRERLRRQEAARAKNRERVKAWAAANPEKVKARREAWKAKNADRQREHARNYYHRHLDERRAAARAQNAKRRADPEVREAEREYRASRRDVLNEQQNARRSESEARQRHNEEQNIRRKVDRRLHKLGLPPRPKHRWTIDERLQMEREQAAAAKRRWTKPDIAKLQEEAAAIRGEAYWASPDRFQEKLEARIQADLDRPKRLAAAVDALLDGREGRRLREEVRMDSIARQLRGADPYPDPAAEARRRAAELIIERAQQVQAPETVEPPDERGLRIA